jgi:hypothetical protein
MSPTPSRSTCSTSSTSSSSSTSSREVECARARVTRVTGATRATPLRVLVPAVRTPTPYRHQRGEGWPTSERAVALLLPFDADEVGLEAGRRPLQDPRDRRSWEARAGELAHQHDHQESRAVGRSVESWNQPGANHRTRVRSHRLPRRVLIGNQALADLGYAPAPAIWRPGAAAAVGARVSDWASASPSPRRSAVGLLQAALVSWRRTPVSGKGVPSASRECIGLALSGHTIFQVGRSGGPRRAA